MDPANPSTEPPQPAATGHLGHSADPLNFHREAQTPRPPRPEEHADDDAIKEGLQPRDVEIISHLGADGRIHCMHRSRPDEWYTCPICLGIYESAKVFSAHTGFHYRSLSTAANAARLRRKHNKEIQNNELQLQEFDDGSVAVVPVNPTSTAAKKRGRKRKINPLADAAAALSGGSDQPNGTALVVGRHDHKASSSGHQCHESVRAMKKRARALGIGGVAAPQSRRGHDDHVVSSHHRNQTSPVVAPQEHDASGYVHESIRAKKRRARAMFS